MSKVQEELCKVEAYRIFMDTEERFELEETSPEAKELRKAIEEVI